MYDKCFKLYDIRSVYQDPLDVVFSYHLGYWIWRHLISTKWIDASFGFASDVRVANNEIIQHFLSWLHNAWIKNINNVWVFVENVWDKKQFWWVCSSSFLYYFCKDDIDIWIVFTASHNPPEWVGMKIIGRNWQLIPTEFLKWLVEEYLPVEESQLLSLENLQQSINQNNDSQDALQRKHAHIDDLLMNYYKSLSWSYNIVVDFSNWAAVAHEQKFLRSIDDTSLNIHYICNKADSDFSIHQSDTQIPHDYETLIREVKKTEADLWIMFDGDGDRLWFVDNNGNIVEGDVITWIIASDLLKKTWSWLIVHDVFTSRTVIDKITSLWWTPIKCRVGHTHVKKLMMENWAIFGWENSWHLFFPEIWWFEFPLLALFHVLSEMETSNKTLSELADPYLSYHKTPLQKIKVKSTKDSLEAVSQHYEAQGYTIDLTDGIWVYDNDFRFVLRPSNTEPVLKLVIESKNEEISNKISDNIISLI